MALEPANFYDDLADGPAGGQAWWVTTKDNVRIRIGGWQREDAKGTVLLFDGRSEYIEKYGRNAKDFLANGYNLLSIDWRGQGLADRLTKDPAAGHVCDFPDYQNDVKAMMDHAEELGFNGPYFLIGHSMGGLIANRSIAEGLSVQAVAFSSPMWGVIIPRALRPFAKLIASTAVSFGKGHSYVLTGSSDNYIDTAEFEDNELTNDPEMWDYLRNQVRAVPEFALGSPTMKWLFKAFEEFDFMHGSKAPNLPCITFLGTDEKIVHPDKIRQRMAKWPGSKLVEIPGGRHEMLMDTPELREKIANDICAFFDEHREVEHRAA